jgi:WD40 repeat protein
MAVKAAKRTIRGIELMTVLRGHEDVILRLNWSPDGKTLASSSVDRSIRLWDLAGGICRAVLSGHSHGVNEVAWAPDGSWLASCSYDRTIRIWDLFANTSGGECRRELRAHSDDVTSVSLSPDGRTLASSSTDSTIHLWRTDTWEGVAVLSHSGAVRRVAWSPDGEQLASCSNDRSVIFWPKEGGTPFSLRLRGVPISVAWTHTPRPPLALAVAQRSGTIRILAPALGNSSAVTLEGHTEGVRSAVFSFDDRLLASSSMDNTVRLWRTDTWEQIAQIPETNSEYWPQGIAFHPTEPILATFGEQDRVIRLWRLDIDLLLGIQPIVKQVHYRNAKVVLLGDTSVGKTGLRMVLTGEPYQPSDSTYGRRVWTFETSEASVNGRTETHETLLWDMAGQPAYRLIHQLHLNEISAALVVFDARSSQGDPLAGVHHWGRALRLARQREGDWAGHLKSFLVVGRADVQGTPVSPERIEAIKSEYDFEAFFETSAKEGWGIRELAVAIRKGIAWEALPSVSSPEMFEVLKSFLIEEKKRGRTLAVADDLLRSLQLAHPELAVDPELRAKFNVCVGRLENRDLVRRLSFGGFILLQPEFLDSYASGMVLGAQSGFLAEEDVLAGRFRMPDSERLRDPDGERLLLLATVEELLEHQLVLREFSDQGTYLVFPTQFNRDWPDAPDPKGKWVIIRFKGPVQNVYATLAVRLAHSGMFRAGRDSMWRNASIFEADTRGKCGLYLREFEEGAGELILFSRPMDDGTPPTAETRFRFEGFVMAHLLKAALAGSVATERLFVCEDCGTAVPQAWVEKIRTRGETWFDCPCGGSRISLVEPKEQIEIARGAVKAMESAADRARDRRVSDIVLRGKEETGEYDVFLCYNSRDRQVVEQIASRLKEKKVRPWLDSWDLRPGDRWLDKLAEIIGSVKAAAVFVGPHQTGQYQNLEIPAVIRQSIESGIRVIPVILPEAQSEPRWSTFLEDFHRVDFRMRAPDPMVSLVYGITGERLEL